MKELSLKWCGPFRWHGDGNDALFTQPEIKKKGIYLWTIPFRGSYLVYYVGKTSKSFEERFKQHTKEYLSGQYQIFVPEKFKKGEKDLFWPGMFKTGGKKTITEFLDYYFKDPEGFGRTLKSFLEGFRLFLAPFNEDPRTIERIEAKINKHLDEQEGEVGNFQWEGVRFRPTKPGEEKLVVKMSYSSPILGMPNKLEI